MSNGNIIVSWNDIDEMVENLYQKLKEENIDKVVGISKLARVIDIFAKRLQTQETMTMQILETIDQALDPLGTAIMIDAKHQCMTTRGISKPNVSTVTTKFSGLFAEDSELRQRFMGLTQAKG